LLTTESRKEFAQRHKGLTEQIEPIGPVEREYAGDFVYNRWEVDRFRRLGVAVLNSAFVPALENILKQLLAREDFETHLDLERAAEDLARRYFHDREAKAEVSSLLRQSGLDETAIEAEGFRLCAADLEALHRITAFKQERADKILLVLAETRQGALACLQPNSDGAPENEVPQLVAATKRDD
jgi:hypothetical protein